MFDYTKDNGQIGINDEKLIPHPDGKAWHKCCKDGLVEAKPVSCAFIKNQRNGARLHKRYGSIQYALRGDTGRQTVNSTPFMCAHRSTDDGYYRVCAGWDACFGNKAITAKANHREPS